MKKLDKRGNDKKIVVTISDKSRKSVLMPMDMYMEVAKKQTSKDQEISWKTNCDIKRKTNYNLGMFRKIFNIGTLDTDKKTMGYSYKSDWFSSSLKILQHSRSQRDSWRTDSSFILSSYKW